MGDAGWLVQSAAARGCDVAENTNRYKMFEEFNIHC